MAPGALRPKFRHLRTFGGQVNGAASAEAAKCRNIGRKAAHPALPGETLTAEGR
jgi:hypothetical protein